MIIININIENINNSKYYYYQQQLVVIAAAAAAGQLAQLFAAILLTQVADIMFRAVLWGLPTINQYTCIFWSFWSLLALQ